MITVEYSKLLSWGKGILKYNLLIVTTIVSILHPSSNSSYMQSDIHYLQFIIFSDAMATPESSMYVREDFKKKNCIFYDIRQIRLLTYLPPLNLDKIIYDNLINIFDLPPPTEVWTNSGKYLVFKITIYLRTSLMRCQFRQDF